LISTKTLHHHQFCSNREESQQQQGRITTTTATPWRERSGGGWSLGKRVAGAWSVSEKHPGGPTDLLDAASDGQKVTFSATDKEGPLKNPCI